MYNKIWKLQDRLHSEKGKVEVMVRTCDSARRAGNTHLLNLRESQAQSEDLQAEITEKKLVRLGLVAQQGLS